MNKRSLKRLHYKKILFLVSKIGPGNKLIISYLQKKLQQDEVLLARFSDLYFEVKGKNVAVDVGETGRKLSDFDFLFFRGVSQESLSIAGSVAVYLDSLGIDYADKTYGDLGPAGDKFTSFLRLSLTGLPTLQTVFCLRNIIGKNAEKIVSTLSLPIIAKDFALQHGKGIRVIRSIGDFKKLLDEKGEKSEKQFIFQKYIKIDSEYRFLVMGEKVRSVQKMYRDTSEFELKIDWNRKEEFLPVESFPPEMQKLAVEAAKTLNIQLAGVDLAIEKDTGKVWIFEVNRGPGFTYDVNISPEIPALADYLREKVNSDQKSTVI